MMPAPVLLRGIAPIAAHLAIGTREAEHLHRQGFLPTFRLRGDSTPHATVGGLDEWWAVANGTVAERVA